MVRQATIHEGHKRLMIGLTAALIGLATLFLPGSADAQGKGRKAGKIPPGHLPPAGSCRVWRDGVPPGHQSPPTSCSNARYEASRSGGRVIYGGGRDDDRDDRYERDRYPYPDDRYPDRYPDDRYPNRYPYPDSRYPDTRYPDDRYPDGRYPDRSYPTSLPEMIGAVIFGRGDRTRYVNEWLGQGDLRVGYSDRDRNGYPEVATWRDPRGSILQQWLDDNRDGRADRVAVYRNGRVVRVIR